MTMRAPELKALIDAAHARGLRVTGHLCAVGFHDAAAMGIDNLEHGFFPATDFVPDKQPDVCPGQARGQQTIAAIDIDGVRVLFPEGWGLARASNTNPYLTLRFEGRTAAAVEQMQGIVYDALRRYPYVTLPS